VPTTTPPGAANPPRPTSRADRHLTPNPHEPGFRADRHLTPNPHEPGSRADSEIGANRRGSAGRARRDLAALLIATFLSWMGQRITAIALPLVALAQTGNVWTTGLVAGAAGLPLLTSGWWAARLRHHITDGPALALTQAAQTLGLLVVPVAALWGAVSAVHLGVCGLLSGTAAALAGPARQALTADVADRLGPGAAARALAWQDLAHRASMILAPPLAAAAVAASGPMPLLWCEAAGLAAAALTITGVRSPRCPATATGTAEQTPHRPTTASGTWEPTRRHPAGDPPVRMRAVLRRHAELRQALVMSGVGGGVWFAYVLGLAVLGAQTGRPGVLIAAGLTGYGLGSVAGALAAPALSTRLPALPTAAKSWIILGLAFLAIAAAAGSPLLIAVLSAIGGAAMPIGIAAVNALISTRTAGAERRAAFAADSVIHDGAATLGMLAGGAVIGLAGARPTLVAAGLLQVAVAVVVLIRWHAGGSRTG
jgi:predicted MFS family arabinose efflux permease